MHNSPLVNKVTYLMFTEASGSELQSAHLSIQKLTMKDDGSYDAVCVTGQDENIDMEPRYGTCSVVEQSDNTVVYDVHEETGQFAGHYHVTFHWLDGSVGTIKSIRQGDEGAAFGVFQIKE